MKHRTYLSLLTFLLFGTVNLVSAGGIHNPSANYFSFADSPFNGVNFTYFFLENFEDGLQNTLGVTRVGGSILLRSDVFSDSVDGDDGVIDNNGNTGGATTGALYSFGAFSIQFDFDASLLGGRLPTHVGLVVTDALTSTDMTLSAFRGGQLLGSITGFQVSEREHLTQQDRFYGFVDLNGIDRIVIAGTTSNDWAMDHLQYGAAVSDDEDNDGVPNDVDTCPNSDLSATVVIDGCDSGVPNTLFVNGCTISDLIAECARDAGNHGQFVKCVSRVTKDLKKAGSITGQQKGVIQSCAATAHIP